MVVLPAPLAPSTVTIFPSGTSRLTPRIATTGPYAVSMLLSLSKGSAMGLLAYPPRYALTTSG